MLEGSIAPPRAVSPSRGHVWVIRESRTDGMRIYLTPLRASLSGAIDTECNYPTRA